MQGPCSTLVATPARHGRQLIHTLGPYAGPRSRFRFAHARRQCKDCRSFTLNRCCLDTSQWAVRRLKEELKAYSPNITLRTATS